MKKIFYIIITHYSLLITNCCFSQWVQQPSWTSQHLYDVWFINTQTGWACGNNGTIVKTTNGGNNWFGQNSGITFPLYSIDFVNNNLGYAVSRVDGYFLKTIDGGNNWYTAFFSPMSLESIYFIDSLRGWAAGTSGSGWVFRTTDGGNAWDSVSVTFGTARHVYFLNSQTGWVSVGSSFFKSTDGGVNWFQQFSTIGNGEISQFSFVNANTGWLVTLELWIVYKTTTGGNNWTIMDTLQDCFNSHSIFFSSLNTGWVCGDCGQIFRTTDGGFNWFQQNSSANYFLNSVQFVNDSVGWVVGGLGTILHTTNGGVVGIDPVPDELPDKFKLYQNYPNPFNSKSNIKYQIPKLSGVKLVISDILGREVDVIVSQRLKPGIYQSEFDGGNFASGLYFYSLYIDDMLMDTKKLILIK